MFFSVLLPDLYIFMFMSDVLVAHKEVDGDSVVCLYCELGYYPPQSPFIGRRHVSFNYDSSLCNGVFKLICIVSLCHTNRTNNMI